MIPASFDYVRAGSAEEAVAALVEHGDEAKVLAGGHSLIPMMRLRLAVPEVLVDITEAGLAGITDAGDHLVIGAATTHHDVATDKVIETHCGVLAHVAATIGDPQVRHRGTIGGGLAHGDSAGDLPAVLLALEGTMVVQGPGGRRTVPASEFFVDYLETAVAADELLVEVHVPKLDDSWGWDYQKFTRVAQAWATVGALALVSSNGTISDARVGLTHMGSVPIRASATEAALAGQSTDAIADAAARAADDTDPPSDLNADADFRRHLATVLSRRALEAAVG
ncbi:FAD binding domain-containing protein [Salsipaludibacter albus]|uniref:FAD binding domain-containing protein n=1 Tax=Salsipaludibacter albus TaxID=2849650 RepID=UPI001EE4541F|nr:xanthine dehydrogenase family protein subunit M [Salsipaludibacter albus]MBY5163065.1 xanthine dehydrogenase family protein subunit M [Salsipaludibacter albus]